MEKMKRPLCDADEIAQDIVTMFTPVCERIIIAGSVRRRKPLIGDIEIVLIPKTEAAKSSGDLFEAPPLVNLFNTAIEEKLAGGTFRKRPNSLGSFMWGDKNKYAIHNHSLMAVDFFITTWAAWFNYLVCRTGGKENNTAIAMAAQAKGWKWNPYGTGFSKNHSEKTFIVTCEKDVYEFVGIKYQQPHERL